MAVTARVERDGLVTAMIALVTMPAQGSGAAADNGIENFDLWPRQCSPIPLLEPGSCRANDVGHLEGWPRHDCGSSVAGGGVGLGTGSWSSGLTVIFRWRRDRCRYRVVSSNRAWPINSWMVRRSVPASSNSVAKE